jgi:prepilin-type N-terminal cleavage/methylation domain-containing protein
MTDWKRKRGLTLIEMLVVVGIIATLMAMVIVVTRGVENQSGEQVVANAFAVLKSALREYYEYADEFPKQPDLTVNNAAALAHIQVMYSALDTVPACRETLKGIDAILGRRHDKQPVESRLYDPWGMPLNYVYVPGTDSFPKLTSAGPDKLFGTGDDITSKGQ